MLLCFRKPCDKGEEILFLHLRAFTTSGVTTARFKLSNNLHRLKPEQQPTADESTQCILQQMSAPATSQVQLHSFPVTKAGGQGPNYDLEH